MHHFLAFLLNRSRSKPKLGGSQVLSFVTRTANWCLQSSFVGNAFMHSALVANRRGLLNRKNVVFCVGNAFMRSETSVNIHGPLDGNGFIFLKIFHSTCPNKNVTEAECVNAFPTKHPNNFIKRALKKKASFLSFSLHALRILGSRRAPQDGCHSFSSSATPWGRQTMMPMVSSVRAGVWTQIWLSQSDSDT